MKMSSLEFPNVMHAISAIDGTNGFSATSNGITTEITVPSGNYTSSALTNRLNGSDNFDNSGNYNVLSDASLNIIIDATTYRTTISCTNNTTFSLDFTNWPP